MGTITALVLASAIAAPPQAPAVYQPPKAPPVRLPPKAPPVVPETSPAGSPVQDTMPGYEWRDLPGVGPGWVQRGIVVAPAAAPEQPRPFGPSPATVPGTPVVAAGWSPASPAPAPYRAPIYIGARAGTSSFTNCGTVG